MTDPQQVSVQSAASTSSFNTHQPTHRSMAPSPATGLGSASKTLGTLHFSSLGGVKSQRLMDRRLRGWQLGLPSYVSHETLVEGIEPGRSLFPLGADSNHITPLMIAVGGGKGGVGKSLVTANLAVRLAATGLRVIVIDLDIGGSNLHTYFGINQPKFNLADVMIYRRKSLSEVLIQTPVERVRLIAGGGEEVWGGTGVITEHSLATLLQEMLVAGASLGGDVLLMDLGAGTQYHTLDFFLSAHLGLVTVLPEPTSIENAYLFMKMALFRLVEHIGVRTNDRLAAEMVKKRLLSEDISPTREHRVSGYAEKLRIIAYEYPHFVTQLALALSGRTLGLTMNQVRSQKDIDIGRSMELIGERYFGFHTRNCGHLNYDEAAWKSLRNRRLLVFDFPHSILAKKFSDLAKSVLNHLGY